VPEPLGTGHRAPHQEDPVIGRGDRAVGFGHRRGRQDERRPGLQPGRKDVEDDKSPGRLGRGLHVGTPVPGTAAVEEDQPGRFAARHRRQRLGPAPARPAGDLVAPVAAERRRRRLADRLVARQVARGEAGIPRADGVGSVVEEEELQAVPV